MKKSLLALIVVAPLTLSGCIISVDDGEVERRFMHDSEDRSYSNRKKIANIQLNSNFIDIKDKLGVADFSESYTDNNDTVHVLYYRTQRKHKDGLTTKDECTYLKFINGKLVDTGSGEEFKRVN